MKVTFTYLLLPVACSQQPVAFFLKKKLDTCDIYDIFISRMLEEYESRFEAGLPVDGREGLVLFFAVRDQVFGIRLTDVSHIEPFEKAENEANKEESRPKAGLPGHCESGLPPATGSRPEGLSHIVWGMGPGGLKTPAVNLRSFLGIEVAGQGIKGPQEKGILIIFREGEQRFGLLADEVQAITPGHQVSELTYPRLLGEDGKKVYGGFFSRDKKLILALNPDYIWTSAKETIDRER